MRILLVLEHFHPYIGGAENLFLELARALTRHGHTVGVVTTRFRPDLPEEETWEGIQIYRVTCRNRYFFSFLSLPRILRVLARYDLIQTTSYNAALPAWIAGRLRRVPVVITFHEVWYYLWWRLPGIPWPWRLAYFLWEQLVLRLPYQHIVAVSRSTQSALLRHGRAPQRLSLIYNGLEYQEFARRTRRWPEHFTFTYFGRLGYSKGLDILLPGALVFLEKHPDARFTLIIPTYPRAMFERITGAISRSGVAGQVRLCHDLSREDLFQEILASSCVVIPSYSEGFCFVAAEATALGVPVIHSGRTALAEVVGGPQREIDPFDPAGLAAALEKARLGDWSIRPVRAFHLSDSVDGYLQLYRSLMSDSNEEGQADGETGDVED